MKIHGSGKKNNVNDKKYTNFTMKFIPKHVILEEYQFNYILDL